MIPLRDNLKSRRFSLVNYLLIAVNIAAFIYQLKLGSQNTLEPFIHQYAVIPSLLLLDPFTHAVSLITSQFLHGGFMHITGNMVYLYIFGDNVEDKLGHFGYLLFYLLCGVGASALQIYFHPASTIPMLGASGAIAGVLGAYFIFHPSATVVTLLPLGFFSRIIEVPAFFFLGFWFLIQAFSGTASLQMAKAMGSDMGGVAWWAHVGGFIVGIVGGILGRLRII